MFGKDFFKKAFEEETNVEQVEVDTPEQNKETPPVEPSKEDKVDVPEVKEEGGQPEIPKFVIDGEEYTIEQIKEWKQGNMRQSDYTRKTQELAQQRKELEALKATKTDEDVTEKSPELERIERIERELASKELDLEITSLKSKYPDFDEVKVLAEADRRGIYDDLEFIYKALRDDKKPDTIDLESVKQQAIEEYKAKIASELQKDTLATSGSIITTEAGTPPVDYGDMLTADEKAYCLKRGWDYKSYVEMINKEYKL